MSVSVSADAGPKPAVKSSPGRTQKAGDPENNEWWVGVVRRVALVVFVAIPVAAPFLQGVAGRVVWTMLVASLPLFIVLIGYHRWRRVCPLAFFAQLPAKFGRAGRRKAPAWLEANYYYLVVGIFFVSLWLRLVATNGDGPAISAFFILLTLSAFVSGLVFTGKTWCNHLCPVSFVEKIYTEPNGLRETVNSQCVKCTACKKFCPDISEENGYWKEIGSPAKRFAYYAFPGLVFGFYFYYYLQSGAWAYYFGGAWTDEPRLFASAFAPGAAGPTAGFFFLPAVPRALASALTLALCGLASLALFGAVEKWMGARARLPEAGSDAERRTHVTFSLAAFTAFVTFYTFAGAPTLWRLPWAVPHLFLVVVVVTATAFLLRRLRRTQKAFAEEALARNIVKRWEWADVQVPQDPREAFIVHSALTSEGAKSAGRVLEVYREAVRDALSEGFVTREDVQRLEQLRARLNVRKADHDKVMAALAADDRALLGDPTRHLTAEKRLQLKSYERALERYVGRAAPDEDLSDGGFIKRLREEYRVTKEEHDAVLDRLMGGKKILSARLAEELHAVERASAALCALGREPSPAHDFLAFLLRRRRANAVERLLNVTGLTAESADVAEACRKLTEDDRLARLAGVEELSRSAAPAVGDYLRSVYQSVTDYAAATTEELLVIYTASVDPYVRAAAALAAWGRGVSAATARLAADEHEVVREVAALTASAEGLTPGETFDAGRELVTIEKMIVLHSVALFSTLPPEELEELARACRVNGYSPGEVLCAEGERGDEIFVVLEGEARVLRGVGASSVLLSVEGPGSVLGEMAVLDPAPRSATVVAGEGGVHALRLEGAAFRSALAAAPSIAPDLLTALVRRLRGAAPAAAG